MNFLQDCVLNGGYVLTFIHENRVILPAKLFTDTLLFQHTEGHLLQVAKIQQVPTALLLLKAAVCFLCPDRPALTQFHTCLFFRKAQVVAKLLRLILHFLAQVEIDVFPRLFFFGQPPLSGGSTKIQPREGVQEFFSC